jgi:hypothetical protein
MLTARAATGVPGITPADLRVLQDGVARPDADFSKVFDPVEQKRHTLRRVVCQTQPDALSEARNHLIALHGNALAPGRPRADRFGTIGEALHVIQDAYSEAHAERRFGPPGVPPHPIVFIRFFGFDGSCPHPVEHRVVPPPDPRDVILAPSGALTRPAAESVSASNEFLRMMMRHLASPTAPTNPAELRAFMDRHLVLDPRHTPTRHFYRPGSSCKARCP